jgi:hypothetical protein
MRIQVAKSKHNYKSGGVFIKQTTCFGSARAETCRLLNKDSTTFTVVF